MTIHNSSASVQANAPMEPAMPSNTEVPATPPPRPFGLWRWVRAIGVLVVLSALGYLCWAYPERTKQVLSSLNLPGSGSGSHAEETQADGVDEHRPKPVSLMDQEPWDGLVTIPERAWKTMGLASEKVTEQTSPIRLELLGTTAYMTDTLTKVRPMFKGRVDKVHVAIGHAVKRGDPLIDLYSKELAEAKSVYQIERIQWQYDKNLLQTREPLVKTRAISQQQYEESKNNEMKSRREYEVARDKLFIYGLTEKEVDKVDDESGADKAKLTLRARAEGFVIERDVVAGNMYDENDTLLVVAPLDRLWVWGNVFESDLHLIELDQSWEVRFPYLERQLQGKVEYISNRVDPETHAVHIRTSIPNPNHQLKSDMLVRGMLEIPPIPGRTVIPRTALIVGDGHSIVFVQVPGRPEKFERRLVVVAQEKDDHVVIESGLKPGETVVSVGALILAQIFEDARITTEGSAPHYHKEAD